MSDCINIHLYLDEGDDETEIAAYYGMSSNPFKVGDKVQIKVDEIYHIDTEKYKQHYKDAIEKGNKELEKKFHKKTIRLVSENKHMTIKTSKASKLMIEYHCLIVNE